MKKFIVARHGHYDSESREGHLTDAGIDQIEKLADSLKGVVEGLSFIVASTRAIRTNESAEIIRQRLGSFTPLASNRRLYSEWCGTRKSLEVVEEIAGDSDCFILVGHIEDTDVLPRAYAEKMSKRACSFELGYGKAWCFDCETAKLTQLP